MDITLFKKLLQKQLISQTEFENIQEQHRAPVTVFWDLSTLLYLGILLFTTGLGILVYKNIDSIGHAAIISLVAVLCAASFIYCFRKSDRYSNEKVESPDVLFDYILLLGCLLMLTLVGYLQFAYNVFGNDWGLATFIPMVALFAAAYYFDHVGVLSLAITNLAAWAGFTVTPANIVKDNDFHDSTLIFTGLILGAGLIAIAFISVYRQIKAHFAFTYKNFGTHVLFISLLGAMFHFEVIYMLWFLILIVATIFFVRNALRERSFYFLVITVLYTYIAISYVVLQFLDIIDSGMGTVYLGLLYFIASGIALIRIFIHYNKQLKKDAHLQ